MRDEELQEQVNELQEAAAHIPPIVPVYARAAIKAAAGILGELVKREVQRNATGER